jgi:HTH-type transcriptional regulator/antitoxin HigA
MNVQNPDITTAVTHWPEMANTLFVPHTEPEYRRLVAVLDALIDEVGEDESHSLASLMEIVGVLIEHYEAEHVPELTSEERISASPSN